MATTTQRDHEILIVGAGFSGIGAGIRLQKAGFDDYLIVEDGEGVGGTWYWNTYPGVAVDIPSFSYQFSFEPLDSWSRTYAPGQELRAYAEHCVDKFGLRRRMRFNTRIVGADFDEHEDRWRLRTAEGQELTARHVINATGVLTQPRPVDIPGVDGFAGSTIHTARWDHTQDLRGKRVAIIGTGASAVQVVPEVAAQVDQLTVFQRTPIWCLPKADYPLPDWVHWVLGRVPGGGRALRLLSQGLVELTFPLTAHYSGLVPLSALFERLARRYLREQVTDPEVRAKLTPQYALGCKRPGFHNTYLQTFNRANVDLETAPIDHIDASAVHTSDGTAHEADVLILATGFKVFEPGNMPPYPISGRNGTDLESWWQENRYQAYEGISVPGFPNFFAVLGPYGYNGSSYFNLVETQTRHILRCLKHARALEATTIEVKPEANERYFKRSLRRGRHQVFWNQSCVNANSYYFDERGDVPFRAAPTVETMWAAGHFDLDDYRFTTNGAPPAKSNGRAALTAPETAPAASP